MSLIVDRRNLDFILFELLEVESLFSHPRYADFDRSAFDHILDTAEQIAEEKFLPIAALADAEEPRVVDGKVKIPDGVADALRAHAEAGFFALPFDSADGGLQAPWVLHTAASGIFSCANNGVANYPFVTVPAANLIRAFGTDELRRIFLPNMLAGRWFGTMCLSEPQAGSSLADIRTTATPCEEGGVYRIKGNKMWISGGEQEISENIVHMVLAKIPGGPPGTKGISLFLVPKRRVGTDGSVGESNNIALAGLNHKMGQRAMTNCLLNFGEEGDCLGYLIGEPNNGLAYMFHMMNEARIGVGHVATMSALGGYLYSAGYAKERTQGRLVGERDLASPQVPIIEHADVRRMLMAQKASVEGAQALCLYCARLVDELACEGDSDAKSRKSELLALLTPVVKSWPSEHCLEANKWAIQILGGYGYTRDFPVERHYRDNRLNHIHEGTFGIQGMDLLGRKIGRDGGQALGEFLDLVRQTLSDARATGALTEEATALEEAIGTLEAATASILACASPELRIANATTYLDGFGHIVIAWIWLRQALVARKALGNTDMPAAERIFYEGKLSACRYFSRYELPHANVRLALCGALDATCLDAPPALFGS